MADTFKDVLEAELKQVAHRRESRKLAPIPAADLTGASQEELQEKASKQQLVGLAFSGGGIRSATFNLGFLQGLAGLGLLKIFDYLSTVSGGGYIGGWLAAWIQRQGAEAVEKELDPDRIAKKAEAELDPIRHLRRYSNYLAPNQNILAADRWVLWAIYLRNFLLNQLMLLPAAAALMLIARLVMLAYYPIIPEDRSGFLYDLAGGRLQLDCRYFVSFMGAFAVLSLIGLTSAFLAASAVRTSARAEGNGAEPWSTAKVRWWVAFPLVLAAGAFCFLGPYAIPIFAGCYNEKGVLDQLPEDWVFKRWFHELLAACAFGGVLVLFSFSLACIWRRIWSWGVLSYSLLAGLVWGALLYAAYALLYWFFEWDQTTSMMYMQIAGTALVTTFGPPLVLLTVVGGAAFGVGMVRSSLPEEMREWWASLSARLLMAAIIWTVVNLIALYGTALVLWAGPWVQAAIASGWLLTVIGGVMAGGSSRTDGNQPKVTRLDLLARLGFYVFVAGIFILVSLLVHSIVDNPPKFDPDDRANWPYRYEPEQPPARVRVSRTGEGGEVSIERKEEYSRVANQAAAAQQRYWLGMVLTDDYRHNPSLYFNRGDIGYLEKELDKAGIPRAKLAPFQELRKWKIAEFTKEVNNYLPNSDEAERIVDFVRQRKKGNLAKFDVDEQFDVDEDLLSEAKPSKNLAPLPYKMWRYEQLQDKIDEVFPEAWNQTIRRKVMQPSRGGGVVVPFEKKWIYLKLVGWLAACGVVLWIAMRRVDVNVFSLQGLYANRLIRAYLGASCHRADADPYTQFDYRDDLPITKLREDAADFTKKDTPPDKPYDGPYPIVNVALNLVHGDKLEWQERKAASFVLTPHHCGSDRESTGYCPTVFDEQTDTGVARKTYAGALTLGQAVAISGAAASPNSGYHSSPAVTFLLTVFNARLGSWLGNPKDVKTRGQAGPWFGMWHLFQEIIGWTDADSPYVYLSDGGHFENLAVYELIKRRCQFIIVCDAGQDETHAFEDLGNMIRKVRIDHRIRIEIAPDFLRLQKEPRHCRWHCAVGRIRYDDVDKKQAPGLLIYVKPSLTGDEPADVLHYAASHPTFPHETTADQFYTESQFESYRALGQHIAEVVFEQARAETIADEGAEPDQLNPQNSREWCQDLFAALVRRWFAMPPEFESKFVQSTHGYIDVQEAFRKDPRLWRLTLDLYPELDSAKEVAVKAAQESIEDQVARRAAEVHIMLQMLQVLENAYLSLDLESTYAHPMNRGWLDVFYRWTSAHTFRAHWPHLRAEFGREFVSFCERQMQLGVMEGFPFPLDAQQTHDLDRLLQEFGMQWPKKLTELQERLEVAVAAVDDSRVWAIYPRKRRDPDDPVQPVGRGELPVGIILIWKSVKMSSTYDLTVWLRGAYRNTGLGRTAMQTILDTFNNQRAKPFELRVRLPLADLTGPGGKLLRAMWITFFNHLGFTRVESAAGVPTPVPGDEVLELKREFR